jgi:heptosyltransferase-1
MPDAFSVQAQDVPLLLPPGPAPQSVLIVKPSSLGDVVHTLPAVAALKNHWPDAKFRWLVNPEWAPLLEGNPCLEEILLFPRASFRGLLGPVRLIQWARQFAPRGASDLVLDFQCLLRSGIIGKLCRKHGFYGLSDAREGARFFYDGAASVHHRQHAVDRYLTLVRSLGAPIPNVLQWPLPETPAPQDFSFVRPYVVLHPFSRGRGKSMTSAQVEALCRGLAPFRVVILGRSTEPVPVMPHVENWLNQTSLGQLVTIMRHAAWVVSVDSGPMHIAAALSTRVLSLHTWSDPQLVGPYPSTAWVHRNGLIFQRGSEHLTTPAPDAPAIAAWVKSQL